MVKAVSEFAALSAAGQPTGEVIGVRRFAVTVRGLVGVAVGGQVVFETGETGLVRELDDDTALILTIDSEGVHIGCLVVAKADELTVPVTAKLLGRMVNPLMRPLDAKSPVLAKQHRPVFGPAPTFSERAILNEQLETGVTIVDTLFPIVLGQRIAIMGDAKSGKTTFATQLTINQARAGRAVVLVLIAKRRTDIDQLILRLEAAGVRDKVALVIADVFDSVMLQYLAPYAGCALAEELWQGGQDTVIIYDDFSSHAKVWREISLVLGANPGRESFPGDMFYTHSSLLERAGKLSSNGKSLTALPLAVTPNDDITGYLSTSLISMTDGQIVFDVATMYQGTRPAVNVGLSVSRVGGRAQSHAHKEIASRVSQVLARARQAGQFAHFGTELSNDMRTDLQLSGILYSLFNQTPDELYTLREQQIMLQTAFSVTNQSDYSVSWLKSVVKDIAEGNPETDPFELASNIFADAVQPTPPSSTPQGTEQS
ncbi:MAG: sodium-transporting two-sector ATPase [Candidatus Saccharibacteria bacterium]